MKVKKRMVMMPPSGIALVGLLEVKLILDRSTVMIRVLNILSSSIIRMVIWKW